MQEKKKSTKKFREREREVGREKGNIFFVRENYAYNRRDSDKFIVRGCE